ncbi:MAG TPA: leucyl/phenylalanyl-tRNA--protein transferase [Burkholderiaceae bacterium]|nr:leucyl/phenylalanyl-tRNA--protein transferase [Burkholderiaceae bacterium]
MRMPLPWVRVGEPLPDPARAWREPSGLLAAGADLSAQRLLEAYRSGIFPWYTDGQPVLWWSPDPRMVLYLDEFRLHRSLAKTIRRIRRDGSWRIETNRAFELVMRACAGPRANDPDGGSWITEQMLAAYLELHRLGHAHSVEIWRQDGEREMLVGGLYGVSIGRMFFGESMFTLAPDASKVALAALVDTLRRHDFSVIDCQQNTRHLASLGAREVSRELARLSRQAGPDWRKIGIGFPEA